MASHGRPFHVFLAAVILGLLLMPPAARGQAGSETAAVRLRIGVTADGLYRVTPADLPAGVDPAHVDPRSFAMSSLGQPVAIRVVADGNDSFDPGEYLEFFGERFRGTTQEEAYTAERVYWLDIGGVPGPRSAEVNAAPQGSPSPPADFAATVRAEQNLVYWALWSLSFDTQDTWFWQQLGTGATATFPYTTPDPAPGYPAVLRVEELSRATYTHRTTVSIGSTLLADTTWTGNIRKVITAPVPAGLLTGPVTTLTIGAPSPSETVMFNYWEVDYRRLFRAFADQLDFKAETAGPQEYSVDAFTSAAVAIWDITDLYQAQRLTDATVSGTGPYTVRFRTTQPAGHRFWLQAESSLGAPASISVRADTGLRAPNDPNNAGPGADTVIVIPDKRLLDLSSPANMLAAWHRAHGRRTLIADLQDIYDEFGQGIRHPKAVRAMMTFAAANWAKPAPTYLTLMGDGHYNMRGYNPAVYGTAPELIPPYLGFYDPWQGEVPSDGLYGDINGDDLPDVAVGRLNVRSLEEANVVVAKTLAYDESARGQPWQQRAVFVADRNDPAAGYFQTLTDEIVAGYLPTDLAPQKIYLGVEPHPDATAARNGLRSAINAGAFMVQYEGHGQSTVWASHEPGGIWTTADVPSLTNSSQLPVVMTFNCLDGYFIHPDQPRQSMAETMLRYADGGSIAAISPTGMGLSGDQHRLRKILMNTAFNSGVQDLGRILQLSKQAYKTAYGMNYLLYTITLFGDPALQIPVSCTAPAPIARVDITVSGADVKLVWPTALNATAYRIWRDSSNPYFAVDPNVTQPYATTDAIKFNATTFTDTGGAADPQQNLYYAVTSVNACANQASAMLQRVGKFNFALAPGQ